MENKEELEAYFTERTNRHIRLVKKYLKSILYNIFHDTTFIPYYDIIDKKALQYEWETHDQSKFEGPEHTPYLWTTVKYRDNLPNDAFTKEQQEAMHLATEHHVKVNKHHPEYWTLQLETINFIDRDKAKKLIDTTLMPLTYVACMVADWMAVAEERGTNPFDWAKSNINIRWKFTKEQEELIYKLLEAHWEGKE